MNCFKLLGNFLLVILIGTACTPAEKQVATPVINFDLTPTATPQILLPGIVSTQHQELNGFLSPDGKAFYFSRENPSGDFPTILEMKQDEKGVWGMPEICSISGKYSDVDPLLSPDGKRMYFCSNRPGPIKQRPGRYDGWVTEKTAEGTWGTPTNLGAKVNTSSNDFYFSADQTGARYYSTWDTTRNTDDIFVVKTGEDGELVVENLGTAVNTYNTEYDPFIAPDGTYLIFSSYRREGIGNSDLYISYQTDTGWTAGKLLPTPINSTYREYCPAVSPDGTTLFFTSQRMESSYDSLQFTNREEQEAKHLSIDNGLGNVYYVSTDFIAALRPQ